MWHHSFFHTPTLTKSAVTRASCVCDPGSHTALIIKLPVSSWGWRARWSTTEPELLKVSTWQSFKPQTAKKSSLQGLPAMVRTVKGTWAVARRVRVSFLLLESACFRRADSWRTVIWGKRFKKERCCNWEVVVHVHRTRLSYFQLGGKKIKPSLCVCSIAHCMW